jgi:hypothetical protein
MDEIKTVICDGCGKAVQNNLIKVFCKECDPRQKVSQRNKHIERLKEKILELNTILLWYKKKYE